MRASREDKPRKLRWTDGARGSTLLPALRRALQIAGLGLSAMVSACAAAPEHPTWDDDVRPLMVARCIRCHAGPADPASAKLDKRVAGPGINLDYQYLSDVSEGVMTKLKLMADYARGKNPNLPRMPPPPAAALEEWQIQMLENWIKDPR
jgi:cytochrome c553